MKWKILLFMFLGLLLSVSAQTTNPKWKTYLEGYEIEHIADAGNYLWLANDTEVIKFDKITGNAIYYGLDGIEISPYYPISSIACAEDGLPWIGVGYNGLLKMNEDEQWIVLPVPNSENYVVGDILMTETGTLWTWLVTPFSSSSEVMENILVRYQGNTVDIFTINNLISSIAEDKDGNLWIGEGDWIASNLVIYDGENWTTFYCPQFGYFPSVIRDIAFDESGNIWLVGTFGIMGGTTSILLQYNGSEWQIYDLPIEYTFRRSFALEDDGEIWLGTNNGLIKFSNYQWTVYNTENSELTTNHINSIVVDQNGTKWMGTDQGLAAFNENGLLSIDSQTEMMNDIVLYPNPAKDFITLKLPDGLQNLRVDILNILGKKIQTFNINNNRTQLDVSFLPSGMYLVNIQSDKNHITKKFVKQ